MLVFFATLRLALSLFQYTKAGVSDLLKVGAGFSGIMVTSFLEQRDNICFNAEKGNEKRTWVFCSMRIFRMQLKGGT